MEIDTPILGRRNSCHLFKCTVKMRSILIAAGKGNINQTKTAVIHHLFGFFNSCFQNVVSYSYSIFSLKKKTEIIRMKMELGCKFRKRQIVTAMLVNITAGFLDNIVFIGILHLSKAVYIYVYSILYTFP